jgi:hypothetical protein
MEARRATLLHARSPGLKLCVVWSVFEMGYCQSGRIVVSLQVRGRTIDSYVHRCKAINSNIRVLKQIVSTDFT